MIDLYPRVRIGSGVEKKKKKKAVSRPRGGTSSSQQSGSSLFVPSSFSSRIVDPQLALFVAICISKRRLTKSRIRAADRLPCGETREDALRGASIRARAQWTRDEAKGKKGFSEANVWRVSVKRIERKRRRRRKKRKIR